MIEIRQARFPEDRAAVLAIFTEYVPGAAFLGLDLRVLPDEQAGQ